VLLLDVQYRYINRIEHQLQKQAEKKYKLVKKGSVNFFLMLFCLKKHTCAIDF